VDHCGGCDSPCTPTEVCASGSCAATCGPGQEDCGGSCADLATDPTHCGECDNACSPGASCVSGDCLCTGGLVDCPGVGCTDVLTDPDNCGVCGRQCVGCFDGECPSDGGDGGTHGSSGADGDVRGGCDTSPSGSGWMVMALLLALLFAAVRRRARAASCRRPWRGPRPR
jgi:hypothetical protein